MSRPGVVAPWPARAPGDGLLFDLLIVGAVALAIGIAIGHLAWPLRRVEDDPVLRLHRLAPNEDEELDEDEARALALSRAEAARGEEVPWPVQRAAG